MQISMVRAVDMIMRSEFDMDVRWTCGGRAWTCVDVRTCMDVRSRAPLYDGIRTLYRHTRRAPHYSVMELHPPPKRHGWGRLKKSVIGVLARSQF